MATLPVSEEVLVSQFGPSLNYPPREGYPGRDEPDKIVETHCCFCGMQCGIKLLVKNNKVVGFEPWEEFPYNQGRLCPKGVQRYLQNNHPDGCCIRSSEPRAPAFSAPIGGTRSAARFPKSSGFRANTVLMPSRCSRACR
jgi:Molybdopterin oxidoreductase Fe4S4 domain